VQLSRRRVWKDGTTSTNKFTIPVPQRDTDQVLLSMDPLACPVSLGSALGGWEILDGIGWLVRAPEQQLCPG